MTRVFDLRLLAGAAALALALVLLGMNAGGLGATALILAGLVGVPLAILALLALHVVRLVRKTDATTKQQRRQIDGGLTRVEHLLGEALRKAAEAEIPHEEIERVLHEIDAALGDTGRAHLDGKTARIVPTSTPDPAWIGRAETAVRTALAQSGARVAPRLEARAPGGFTCPRASLTEACAAWVDHTRANPPPRRLAIGEGPARSQAARER